MSETSKRATDRKIARQADSKSGQQRRREGGIGEVSLTEFHITSTHSMINADHELAQKCTDSLFQLHTVRKHDNHELMRMGMACKTL